MRIVKNRISGIAGNPLIFGSAVMVVGSNLANFLAWVYHFVISRSLSVGEYGDLVAAISIIGMAMSGLSFFGLVIVKFVASSTTKEELSQLYGWFQTMAFRIGIASLIIFSVLAPVISNFLHVDLIEILIIGPILFLVLVTFMYKSFLQGLLRFGKFVVISNVEMGGRLVFGLIFVLLGLSVAGAISGILMAELIALLVAYYFLKDFKTSGEKVNFDKAKEIAKYSAPVFLYSFLNTSFFTSDLLLVKHFFSSHDAGIYAAVSTLGKIIFFASAPLLGVMFPIVAKKYSEKEPYKKYFVLSFSMVAALGTVFLLLYWFFPNIPLLLYKGDFAAATRLLFDMGLFLTIYTLASLTLNFYLSINNSKVVSVMAIAAAFQVIGIWLFHESLTQVIRVSTIVSGALLFFLLIYFFTEKSYEK